MIESAADPLGNPVQIIDIEVGKTKTRLKLHNKELWSILEMVGDHPIALVSIAGPSRMGKSFLLSYMLRYLNALENGCEDSWIGPENQVLTGFAFKNCVERITTGFWMWSHPFIIERSDGKKIAVILMDTQGVFDSHTNEAAWSAIVALCALTSSCLIYNLFNNLQEDALLALQTFVEYTHLAMNEGNEEFKFEKLIFLIRDWSKPDDFTYGPIGGANFIKERFKEKEYWPRSSKEMKQALQDSFKSIDCFLMPRPDEKVLSSKFKGTAAEMDSKFKKYLHEFVSSVLSPEDIFPKSFNGKDMTANQLNTCFEKYVQIFSDNQLVTPMSIFEATAKASNQELVNELEKMYKTEIQNYLQAGNGTISAPRFGALHDSVQTKIFEQFEKRKKLGDIKMQSLYRRKLEGGITSIQKTFLEVIDLKWTKLKTELVRKALQIFIESIQNETPEMYILEQELDNKILHGLNAAKRFLEKECEGDEELFKTCISEAEKLMGETNRKIRMENQKRKDELDLFYEKVYRTAFDEYKNNMENFILLNSSANGDNFIEEAKLEAVNEAFTRKSLNLFEEKGNPKLFDTEIHNNYKKRLLDSIQQMSSKIKDENSAHIINQQQEIEIIIRRAIDVYNSELSKHTDNSNIVSLPKTTDLEIAHSRSKSLAIEFFETNSKINNVKLLLQYKTTLIAKLEEEFSKKQKAIIENVHEATNKLKLACKNAEEQYAVKMKDFIKSRGYISSHEITNHHQQMKMDQVEVVKKSSAFRNFPKQSEVERMMENMEQYLKKILQESEQNEQIAVEGLHKSYKDLIEFFKHQLPKNRQTISVADWKTKSEGARISTLKKFASQMTTFANLPSFENTRLQFESDIDEIINAGTDNIVSRMKKDEELLQSKISSIKEDYQQKMASITSKATLRDHHKAYKRMAINNLNRVLEEVKPSNLQEILLDFDNGIEQEFLEFLESQELKSKQNEIKMRQECDQLLVSAKQDLENIAQAASTEEELQMQLKKTTDTYLYKCGQLMNGGDQKLGYDQVNVEAELKKIGKSLILQYRVASQQQTQDNEKMLKELEEFYSQLFQKSLMEKNLWENHEIEELDKNIAQKTKNNLSTNYQIDPKDKADCLQSLTIRFDKLLNNIKNNQNEKKTGAINEMNKLLNSLVSEYQVKMENKMADAADKRSMAEAHESIEKSVKTKFLSGCPFSGNEKKKYEALLDKKVKDAFTDLELAFATKQKCNILSKNSKAEDCKQYYLTEITKNIAGRLYVAPSDLSMWHQAVKTRAFEKFADNSGNSELEKIMNDEYKILSERNTQNIPTNPAIGIDLGTTFSCVAVYHNGNMQIVPNELGKRTTPSYVAFNSRGDELIGNRAKDQSHENPQNTIFDAKRLIGRRFDDPLLQNDIKLLPYTIVQEGGIPKIQVNGKTMHPEEISGKLLKKLKEDAEKFLKCKVTNAVITVPAYFNDGQRQATKDAGELAGLKVMRIINEPSAAAFAYSLEQTNTSKKHVLVFDFGGGTFDIAILKMEAGNIDTLSVIGDTHLGGEDFDSNLVDYCIQQFKQHTNLNILDGRDSEDERVKNDVMRKLRRLRNECEKRKIDLSDAAVATVNVVAIHEKTDLEVDVTKEKFEEINAHLFKKSIDLVHKSLDEANLKMKDIDDIVLVGGSTRIPKIQSMLKEYFGGKMLSKSVNPDEAVACGAAIQAAILNGNTAVMKNSAGAGLALKVTDVTPYSYGIEVFEGDLSIIIPKNTPIPTSMTKTYLTAYNNQTSVLIVIYDGEEKKAANNHKAGEFYLNGIPSALAGQQKVKVTMIIDHESILNVTAVCESLGHTTDLTIRAHKGRMSSKEINALAAK